MIKFTAGNKSYVVEFRHITTLGKRAQLHSRTSPIKAVTTCVIIEEGSTAIAVDNSICSLLDGFSRLEGRLRSLHKLLRHNKNFQGNRNNMWFAYLEAAKVPQERRVDFDKKDEVTGQYVIFAPAEVKRSTPKLSDEEKQRRRDSGREVREKRQQSRGAQA